jgi:hypothetical protein
MIRGCLAVDLEPCNVRFTPSDALSPVEARLYCLEKCSLEDIRALLEDVGVLEFKQPWSPSDCILRMHLDMPKSSLKKWGFSRQTGC